MAVHGLIKCPSCENLEFEAHSMGNLNLTFQKPPGVTIINSKRFCTCTQCGYRIDGVDDLKLTTIDVYIVGDSISGRRQGLSRITMLISYGVGNDKDRADMDKQGYFEFTKPGHSKAYVFTKSAWKRAENDPEFRLIEGQYAVNLQDMTL